jgi:tetratricopeptide (TPR) repeat protein
VKAHLLGDGYQVLKIIFKGEIQNTWLDRSEPLTAKIILSFYSLLKSMGLIDGKTGWGGTEIIFILTGIIAGLIYLYCVIEISGLLSRNDIEKVFISSFLLFSGSSLLFFGYVEVYPLPFAFISLYFLFSLKYLFRKASIIYPIIIYLLSFFSHFGFIVLFPTLLLLFFIEYKRYKNPLNLTGNEHNRNFGKKKKNSGKHKDHHRINKIIINCLIILASLFIIFLISGYSIGKLFSSFTKESSHVLPFFESGGVYNYPMFSFYHISDFLNHSLLLSPLILTFFIIILIFNKKNILWNNDISLFLSFAFVLSIGFEFILKHEFGMSLDWDILAAFLFPLSLLPLYHTLKEYLNINKNQWIINIGTGILLIHFIPWILINSDGRQSIERTKALIDERILPKAGIRAVYGQIYSYYELNGILSDKISILNEAIGKFPDKAFGYLFLSETYKENGNEPKYLEILKQAEIKCTKDTSADDKFGQKSVYSKLGEYYHSKHTDDSAIIYYRKVISIDTNDAGAYYNIGLAEYNLKDYKSSIYYYTKSIEININDASAYYNRGLAKYYLTDINGSIHDYTKTIELNPKHANAYLSRGLAKLDLNDRNGACQDFSAAGKLGLTRANDVIKKYCK